MYFCRMISEIKISDFTYDLPEERIAKFPLASRELSKLLVFKDDLTEHRSFVDIEDYLPANALLVFNNTRVVQARLLFSKTEGAKPIEVFCLEPFEQEVEMAMAATNRVQFYCLVGNAKRWNDTLILSREISLGDEHFQFRAEKVRREGDSFIIQFSWDGARTFAEVLEEAGKVPLPPYLKRDSEQSDKERYQTVYAKHNGSVAAPTAGLHFTEKILAKLATKGISIAETTLHVGAGTFKPVSTEDVRNHEMHAEEVHITASFVEKLIAHNGPIFSVGTTSTRTLESLYWMGVKCLEDKHISSLKLNQWDAYNLPQNVAVKTALEALLAFLQRTEAKHLFTHTQLIIAPGYQFRMIDGLITNFHQPGSTLILLVAAAVGQHWKNIYAEALKNDYRFLSYGDSSLLFIDKK